MGLSNEAEGAQVSKADPSQDDVAELATGGLDHGGVPKPSVIKCSYKRRQINKHWCDSNHNSHLIFCFININREYYYLIKTEVTKSVARRPRQAKTTAAMGSGSPQRTYCTGMGSHPEGQTKAQRCVRNTVSTC